MQPSAESINMGPQTLPQAAPGGARGQVDASFRPDDAEAPEARFMSPDDELYIRLRDMLEEGRDRTRPWRLEAREARQITAGHQWDEDDKSVLRATDRQEITFNRVGRNVNFVAGQEINAGDELAFLPRRDGDVQKSEMLGGTIDYINDETESPAEVSDAFRDLLETGMGWTETYMDYRNFAMGLPRQVRRDCLAMFWDSYAVRRNLADADWVARAVSMPMASAMRRYRNINPAMLNAFWLGFEDDPSQPTQPERQSYGYDEGGHNSGQPVLSRVTLIEIQWREVREVVEMEDLYTAERATMPRRKAEMIMRAYPGRFRGLPREKWCYYTAVLGGMLLSKRELKEAEDFTFQCMTGQRDGEVCGFIGIVRAMKDPQKWANKWLSQTMYVMNRNAKGGVVVETGSFTDPVAAERDWGKTGSFTWAEPGAVREGRFREKETPQLPQGLDRLMPMALEAIQDCAGIPAESLGTTASESDAGRSAVFEQARREAGLVLMKPLFDAKRLHTRRQGRIMLRFILNFMNDGRLVRIVDEGQEKYVPLLFEDKDAARYDIIVSDAANSPNQRMKTWGIIESMMQYIAAAQPGPDFWSTIIRASPLPSKVQNEFVQHLQRQKEAEQDQPQEELSGRDAAAVAKLPAEIAKLAAEKKRLEAQARELEAKTKELETQAMYNLARIEGERTGITLDALEGMRETFAVEEAANTNRLRVQEYA